MKTFELWNEANNKKIAEGVDFGHETDSRVALHIVMNDQVVRYRSADEMLSIWEERGHHVSIRWEPEINAMVRDHEAIAARFDAESKDHYAEREELRNRVQLLSRALWMVCSIATTPLPEDRQRVLEAQRLIADWSARKAFCATCEDWLTFKLLCAECGLVRPTPRCTVYDAPCLVHNFVHGAEAEDLRKGIETLLANDVLFQDEDGASYVVTSKALQALLDRVDARDSLAYLEAQGDSESATDLAWREHRRRHPRRNHGSVQLVEVCVPDLPKLSIGERGPGPWWTARSGLDPCDGRHPPQPCCSDRCYVKRERIEQGLAALGAEHIPPDPDVRTRAIIDAAADARRIADIGSTRAMARGFAGRPDLARHLSPIEAADVIGRLATLAVAYMDASIALEGNVAK